MCVFACKSPFGVNRREPCKDCKAKYDELMDAEYEYYQRRKAVKAFRLWLRSLATDWLDASHVALYANSDYQKYQQTEQRTQS